MKRFAVVVFLLFLLSCVHNREITGNSFVCRIPQISIDISGDFEYLGKTCRSKSSVAYQRHTKRLREHSDIYVFFENNKNNAIERFVLISYRTSETQYANTFSDRENKDYSDCYISGKKFHVKKNVIVQKNDSIISEFFIKNGKKIHESKYNVVTFIMDFNYGAKSIVEISYFESFLFSTCHENVLKRAYESFTIPQNEYTSNSVSRFDGLWAGSSERASEKSEKGAACSEISDINIDINGGEISGDIADSQGHTYNVSGGVDKKGNLTAGVAFGGKIIVSFKGSIEGVSGTGTYRTKNNCKGTWQIRKVDMAPNTQVTDAKLSAPSQTTASQDNQKPRREMSEKEKEWLKNIVMGVINTIVGNSYGFFP